MRRDPDKLGILRGTLDVLVLKSLSGRPLHGFEISLWLDEHSNGALNLDDSALYQCLHRLEARADVLGEWGLSENNRRARYYRLTASGRRRLAGEGARLVSYARAIMGLLAAAPRTR
jgi:DNA-binding PadR family transcriptional regulator